jgi:hypothetical protein
MQESETGYKILRTSAIALEKPLEKSPIPPLPLAEKNIFPA